MINFRNTYTSLPERFFQKVSPAKFPAPKLLAFNHSLSKELGMVLDEYSDDQLAKIFSGQIIPEGSEPLAMAYAGFQFGHAVPQLGDGRAMLLGEVNGFDIHLKGSGQTPYSRRGDGRSALGPVIREYIISEAMNVLGVPTTRALAAVATGEKIDRQFGLEPGGVFARVASSHIRVGTFQYFAFRQDKEAIETLLNYTIKRHYPDLLAISGVKEKAIALLKAFAQRQGDLIAKWSSLGFIHGVMNTDNCALAGITIDYGPCAFMEEFKFQKVFSSIDERGRYSFFNQVPIIQWNILRLADCLLPIIDVDQDQAARFVESELIPILKTFDERRMKSFALKLGIQDYRSGDEAIVMMFLTYLESNQLDFTMGFRNLTKLYHYGSEFYPETDELKAFIEVWKQRVNDVSQLNSINPIYIPRNHQVQKAIDDAYQGDATHFLKLLEVLKNPYEEKDDLVEFAQRPTLNAVVNKTYCGT